MNSPNSRGRKKDLAITTECATHFHLPTTTSVRWDHQPISLALRSLRFCPGRFWFLPTFPLGSQICIFLFSFFFPFPHSSRRVVDVFLFLSQTLSFL